MDATAQPRQPASDPVQVRDATLDDIDAIREVAVAAWWATYQGLISDDAIGRFTELAYSPERIAVRMERHTVLVAGTAPGNTSTTAPGAGIAPPARRPAPVEAFAETVVQDDHVQVVAIYALPGARGRGLGSALLERIRELHPGEDLAADVLVGNGRGEPFYAARGFEPGELLVDEIAGEEIRERRWWLRATPAARSA